MNAAQRRFQARHPGDARDLRLNADQRRHAARAHLRVKIDWSDSGWVKGGTALLSRGLLPLPTMRYASLPTPPPGKKLVFSARSDQRPEWGDFEFDNVTLRRVQPDGTLSADILSDPAFADLAEWLPKGHDHAAAE